MVLFVMLGVIGWMLYPKSENTTIDTSQVQIQATEQANSESAESLEKTDGELLLYLIEEEKLAHDVYTVMYEEYGERVFGNILRSEQTHQDKVLSLLNQYNLTDPRSDKVGVFTNTELQALYDSLIEKGMKSEQDAFEVGVMIEEKDIKDISDQLAITQDDAIVTVLEELRRGSENHLRAFNRQLDRR